MENKITQPVFYETLSKENYSGWRIFFAEQGYDHKGAEIFAKFIKETLNYDLEQLQNTPASQGDSPSDNPINPQAFIDYLNGNNKENKKYPELIEKLRAMDGLQIDQNGKITSQGEQFTDYNMLYFANALKDLGLLNLDDKQFIGYFDKLLIKPTATSQAAPLTDTQSSPQAPVSLREEKAESDQPETPATSGQTFSLGGGFNATSKDEVTSEKDQEKAATKAAAPTPQAAKTQNQSADNQDVAQAQEADKDQEEQPAQPPIVGSAPLPTSTVGGTSTPQTTASADITTEQDQKATQEIDKKIPVETAAQSGQVAKITPAQQVVQMPKGQGRILQTQTATNQKNADQLQGTQPDQQQKNTPEKQTTIRRTRKNTKVAKGMPFAAKVGLGVGGGGFTAIMGTMFFSTPPETTALIIKFLA